MYSKAEQNDRRGQKFRSQPSRNLKLKFLEQKRKPKIGEMGNLVLSIKIGSFYFQQKSENLVGSTKIGSFYFQ